MFNHIRKIIAGNNTKPVPVQKQDPVLKRRIAASVLLLEAAHVDNECTDEEMDHVIDTLKSKFDLSHEYTEELITLAHEEKNKAVDLWEFTNHMNQHLSLDEKLAVMEDVWRIIHVDGKLEKHEDHFAHKLANLLRLTHKQLIDAKIKARD